MTAPSPQPAAVAAAPAKRARGRETGADMIRSLGIVLLIVFVLWFFARPPASDVKRVRAVDPGQELTTFSRQHPGVPLPRSTPSGFTPTSSTLDTDGLRIGYVTPEGQYAEFAASTRPGFAADQSAKAPVVGAMDIDSTSWQQRQTGRRVSLVRTVGSVTEVVGGLRESASLAELRVLAGAVPPG